MTPAQSLLAVLLSASISIVACNHKNEVPVITPEANALFISFGGGSMPRANTKKLQITPEASYEITITAQGSTSTRLADNIHDSLKQYLSSFPIASIKADSQIASYSQLGTADNAFQTFTSIQKAPADTTNISIDYGIHVPYMDDFQKKINQTIANCKLLGD
ncbi:hypothetical protein ACTJJ0_16425 [Chitinophaga sp. 22321]|uniref:Lipoprotein n=1 Tax=Chitinophaga hostae TaxID=2831022 RepID=A0ABS5J2P4_9BACT|nr:hypothetical protein [Chitinophaga hostae]MBS0029338.1 hypothetical protein [Chitinophaga hostae]